MAHPMMTRKRSDVVKSSHVTDARTGLMQSEPVVISHSVFHF